MEKSENVLNIDADRYNCITVAQENYLTLSDEEFEQKLAVSLDFWKKSKINCILVNIKIEHSSLIPICVKLGFTFHHAQPSYVHMQQWLSTEQPINKYPKYAHHYIGAGGFVVNDKQQVLVVKEKVGPGQRMRGWKLPGGYVEMSEDLGDAASREVFEETGVECDFQSVVAFRHQHKYSWGCSDFYFVCLMKPRTDTIKICDYEIEECKWMALEEYASHPEVHAINQYFAQQYLKKVKTGEAFIECVSMVNPFRKNMTKIYTANSIRTDSDQS